jgi:hypothetical protein
MEDKLRKEYICKYCGEKFTINHFRQSTEHCKKEECIKKNKKEIIERYLAKKKDKNIIKDINKDINKDISKNISEDINKSEIKTYKNEGYEDILKLAKELGRIRFELIELIKKESENVSEYDKKDQTFLHSLEFLDTLSDEDAIKMVIEEKKNRVVRRNIKNRKLLIQSLLDGISIKAPNAFVSQVINSDEDFKKKINKLKKNEVLWLQINREENECVKDNNIR